MQELIFLTLPYPPPPVSLSPLFRSCHLAQIPLNSIRSTPAVNDHIFCPTFLSHHQPAHLAPPHPPPPTPTPPYPFSKIGHLLPPFLAFKVFFKNTLKSLVDQCRRLPQKQILRHPSPPFDPIMLFCRPPSY